MKYLFLIVCLFTQSISIAQKKIVKEVRLFDNELQSVISSSKILQYIQFNKKDFDNIELYPDTFSLQAKSSLFKYGYDLEYPGHRYLFEKQFGKFPMARLLKILDSLKLKPSEYNEFEGKIYADHIFIKQITFHADKDANHIFMKVYETVEYDGGQQAFIKHLQEKINNSIYKNFIKNDSAFFFRAVLKRDSLIHDIRSFDSLQSEFIDFLTTALKETSWKPYKHGGLLLNKYLQLFIMVRKYGIIEAGYY